MPQSTDPRPELSNRVFGLLKAEIGTTLWGSREAAPTSSVASGMNTVERRWNHSERVNVSWAAGQGMPCRDGRQWKRAHGERTSTVAVLRCASVPKPLAAPPRDRLRGPGGRGRRGTDGASLLG